MNKDFQVFGCQKPVFIKQVPFISIHHRLNLDFSKHSLRHPSLEKL